MNQIMRAKITVIINAYNEEKMIGACLDSLLEQARKPNEILVVENGSTDRTVEISRQKGARVLSIPRCTRGEARDFGWRNARGEIVVYGDADDIFGEEWLAEIEKKFDEGFDAVIDRLQVWSPDTFYTNSLDAFYAYRAEKFIPVLAWAFRKKILEKAGGFKNTWLEEAELGVRLQKMGVKIGHAKHAYRFHRGKPRGFADLFARSFFFGKNEYRDIFTRFPEKIPWLKIIFPLVIWVVSLLSLVFSISFIWILPFFIILTFGGIFIKLLSEFTSVRRMSFVATIGVSLSGVINFWVWPLGVVSAALRGK